MHHIINAKFLKKLIPIGHAAQGVVITVAKVRVP
jgi:hypothetical protein